jgi:hypothetical protein
MRVVNIHERVLTASMDDAGALIDSLASQHDLLWPVHSWPAMRFDRPLGIGANGGHGPIRYVVEAYEPGRAARFRFGKPKGFLGCHRFEIQEVSPGRSVLRHVIEMRTAGSAWLTWAIAIRPLHDALIDDALDRAERHCGGTPGDRRWSLWVRFLRWAMRRGRAVNERPNSP